jgi:hypothetical protein
MKALLGLALLAITTTSSFAREPELDLFCLSTAKDKIETRSILVSEDGELRTLRINSSPQAKSVRTYRYAVVIDMSRGVDAETWEVLSDDEFGLRELRYERSRTKVFLFRDFKNKKSYKCEINGEVRANPALSRSN